VGHENENQFGEKKEGKERWRAGETAEAAAKKVGVGGAIYLKVVGKMTRGGYRSKVTTGTGSHLKNPRKNREIMRRHPQLSSSGAVAEKKRLGRE